KHRDQRSLEGPVGSSRETVRRHHENRKGGKQVMRVRHWFFSAPALAALLVLGGGQALVGAEKKKDLTAFGALEAPSLEVVKAEAGAWAKKAGLAGAKQKQFEAIWKEPDLSLTERVNRTLLLDDAAAKLVAAARNTQAPAPTVVPAILKDAKQPKF